MNLPTLRQHIQSMSHADEHACVLHMREMGTLSTEARERILNNAMDLTARCRADKKGSGPLDAFLLEFGLSSKEGVALMCLAEALLRVPDALTCDRLIAEKLQSGNWKDHNGRSHSLFVNASTWGLMLTGKIVQLDENITEQPSHWIKNLVGQLSEPVVRLAVLQAMRIMGGQYVLGKTITEASKRGRNLNRTNTRFSFDMLGEGARTYEDAQRYFDAYSHSINTIGQHQANTDVYNADGISVKLSALHPRYSFLQKTRVMNELYPKIKSLCLLAKQFNIGLSIDAEEADRLDLSLDIFEKLARDEALSNWQGLGFVLQAYQKRSPYVAQWLIKLAESTDRRLMVRLVKGAYWDAEIKHAQEEGLVDFPVYTRKSNTDLSYQFCANILLDAQEQIYAQFATHNAYTAAVISEMAGNREFEFQRLHGMGDLLYKQLRINDIDHKIPVRVYAPVGEHNDLLPYLVRRLLENGANSSFVNRFLDNKTPIDELIKDVDSQVTQAFPYRHNHIEPPLNIFQSNEDTRANSKGIDLDNPSDIEPLINTVTQIKASTFLSQPIVNGNRVDGEKTPSINPADHQQVVGQVIESSANDIDTALNTAADAFPEWNQLDATARAIIIERIATTLELKMNEFVALICFEAGRTLADGISEVREAIDFCRYYAAQAKKYCEDSGTREGRGVFLCISPWNFPLAIFTGQIAAALAAGNTVIAKPAEQTPLIAAKTIELFYQAGIPNNVLHFLPGNGAKIGNQLISDPRIAGVCFTGSTDTALLINRRLGQRKGARGVFIAETGGQNVMIVDSTALAEQVVDDVIGSAFMSAGQRCSALRVLFLQNDIADNVIKMLKGAMQTLVIGDPSQLSTDIGPVIDNNAKNILETHVKTMRESAKFICSIDLPDTLSKGSFFAPHVFELASLDQLPKEVFGPVLHIIRYDAKNLSNVISQINDSGYGLTLGIHSRIEMFAEHVYRNTSIGNTYINRNMVGAVVGVNPFGGQGLSGTGPKAGGPNYLLRFTRSNKSSTAPTNNEHAIAIDDANNTAMDISTVLNTVVEKHKKWRNIPHTERMNYLLKSSSVLHMQLSATDRKNALSDLQLSTCVQYNTLFMSLAERYLAQSVVLPGPTGEENILSLQSKGVVLCLPENLQSAVISIFAAITAGCSMIVAHPTKTNESDDIDKFVALLHEAGISKSTLLYTNCSITNAQLLDDRINAVAVTENLTREAYEISNILASRDGAIIPLIEVPNGLDTDNLIDGYALLVRFLNERTRTDNIVARGGNTQLFNLTE